jgi:hypothetical protein
VTDFALRVLRRARTALALLGYFLKPDRYFLVPLVVVVLLAGVLIAASAGLSRVAPFVYTLF